MSDTPTPETDEARMKGYGEFGGDWSPLERNCYEKHPEGDVVFCEVAEKLERERDEARRELAILKAECAKISEEFGLPPTVRPADGEIKRMINGWKEALEERDEARRDLVASEELHRRRFDTLKGEFDALKKDLDWERKELQKARKSLNHIGEYGTEEINAAVTLRQKLAQALVARDQALEERDEARAIAKMAYIRMTGLGVSANTPIQFMRDTIKQWAKEQKEEAK